jgi:hypothetical protein
MQTSGKSCREKENVCLPLKCVCRLNLQPVKPLHSHAHSEPAKGLLMDPALALKGP